MRRLSQTQVFWRRPSWRVLTSARSAAGAPQKIAELFGCFIDNVSLHLKNIYQENEVDQKATSEDFSLVQNEGDREVQRKVKMYSNVLFIHPSVCR